MLELWVLVGLWIPYDDSDRFDPRGMMTELAVVETISDCYRLKTYAMINTITDPTVERPDHYYFFCLPKLIKVKQ